tara:strand:- start:125 stop:712 length:588 start_codon:yes stop_codon:yes gene_type:complete
MFPRFIRLGVETILKMLCEKIIIKNILIVNKKDKFNGIIDELYIKAESIIFNKINISNINIKIKDIILKFPFNKNNLFTDKSHAKINIRLTKDNINKTLLNKKWKSLKESIESYISMRFNSIEINNKSIYFISLDGLSNNKINYNLQYDKNNISLVNNINHKKLLILNDNNITVQKLFFYESYIEIELISKIIFN